MKVAFDIDDTITRNPKFFSLVSKALVKEGHQVLIITFRTDRLEAHRFLKEMDIEYTYLNTPATEDQFERDINRWKSEICRQYQVDVFFEDMPEVLKHIEPPTLCFMPVGHDHQNLGTYGW